MPAFSRGDLRLHYGRRGSASGRPVVLLHGLLLSSHLMERLAARLPEARVLLLDLHGHGKSSKPTDRARYTWDEMAADVVALFDHAGLERAVVGGISLGANVALATALAAPERVEAMVLEMPVLARGYRVGRPGFGTVATAYAAGRLALGPLGAAARRLPLPRGVPELAAWRDVAGADPRVATAVLRGLLAEPPLGGDAAALARLAMPALVVGHRRDPLHALDDARELAERLANATWLEASTILQHRYDPERLAAAVRHFLAALDQR